MSLQWLSDQTLFCSSKAKKARNKANGVDTLLIRAYNKDNTYKHYQNDYTLDEIDEKGRDECERIAMDEFILL